MITFSVTDHIGQDRMQEIFSLIIAREETIEVKSVILQTLCARPYPAPAL